MGRDNGQEKKGRKNWKEENRLRKRGNVKQIKMKNAGKGNERKEREGGLRRNAGCFNFKTKIKSS